MNLPLAQGKTAYHLSYKCRTNSFKHSFFPSTLNDWFNLDINIGN